MNFDGSVDHTIDGLVDNDGGLGFLHDFVDLVALGADEEGNHALWDENDDTEGLGFDFFELLVDVGQKELAALVLFLHFFVINLNNRVGT